MGGGAFQCDASAGLKLFCFSKFPPYIKNLEPMTGRSSAASRKYFPLSLLALHFPSALSSFFQLFLTRSPDPTAGIPAFEKGKTAAETSVHSYHLLSLLWVLARTLLPSFLKMRWVHETDLCTDSPTHVMHNVHEGARTPELSPSVLVPWEP